MDGEYIRSESISIIKRLFGEKASFREGQYEAIEATLTKKRTLVVQKTGWGKSLVYFVSTKIRRNNNFGVSLIVSPLLVLMENQIEAAKKIGLKCDLLNSTVKDRREEVIDCLKEGNLDLVLITPETLFSDDFQDALKDIDIGLFVIDEAHCISDWGHDFRLDYGNLNKVIKKLPINVPILATTATANDRVVKDLVSQLGDDVYVSRGNLTRDSLAIQILKLENRAERYAWILENINKLDGSGIIYCLTQRDCDNLSNFLNENNIVTRSYFSRKKEDEHLNTEAEELFKVNKIKALVSTIKLGMGYDKGDIGFVIHYQQPANIVSYYQQIGRAGRNIEKSYAILMTGKEDHQIIDYFIDTAFPSKNECEAIISILENTDGLRISEIYSRINNKRARIEKTISFLMNEGNIYKEGGKYYLSAVPFIYNDEHYSNVTLIRKQEKQQLINLIKTTECYSKFIVNALDDYSAVECGICSNCIGEPLLKSDISSQSLEKAMSFIDALVFPIIPRKKWAKTSLTKQIKIKHQNEVGICLSKYGDVGYGELVKKAKYEGGKGFSEELVEKSAEVLREVIHYNKIKYITFVPSLRNDLVEEFAKALAKKCELEVLDLLIKEDAKQQKFMQNSSFQCENALTSFKIKEYPNMPENVILVDDIVDSKWTLTICGYLLMENGCEKVFPFALADSSQKEKI